LISSGGNLVVYSLDTIGIGDSTEAHLHFVEDHMFDSDQTFFFEHICILPNRYVNILISAIHDSLCVIFLDVTSEVRRIESMQQAGNELSLCKEQLGRLELELEKIRKDQ